MGIIVKSTGQENQYRSGLEELFAREWIPTMNVDFWMYEAVVLKTGGGNYTPDFLLVHPDKTMTYVEVKGSWKQRGGDRSKRILREAAAMFSWQASFVAILPTKQRRRKGVLSVDGWSIEDYSAKWGNPHKIMPLNYGMNSTVQHQMT